jgi:hypothetical protein
MISANALLVEQAKIVVGLPPRLPSTSTPDYVCMKGYHRLTAIIVVDNATTVTGSAITLKQATAVAGTAEKALAFATMYANLDVDATDTLVATAVTSDTFTTVSTNNVNAQYVIEVKAEDLDMDNGFDCVRVGTGDGVATAVAVIYILWPAKQKKATPPSAIID